MRPSASFSRALRPVAASLAGVAALACSSCATIQVPAGPDAANSACADVVRSAPRTLLDQSRHATSSQGTLAWGSGGSAIVMRCGVTPPAPTSKMCTTLTDAHGTAVDWIVEDDGSSDGIVHFTTYGRTPAVDLTVPRKIAGDQPSAAALDLTSAVSGIPATRNCLGVEDVK